LALINTDPDELLKFLTVDEIWVQYYDSESKRQSIEWRHEGSLPPRTFRVTTSASKIMPTVFWDFERVEDTSC
jgi:hypothetical protein